MFHLYRTSLEGQSFIFEIKKSIYGLCLAIRFTGVGRPREGRVYLLKRHYGDSYSPILLEIRERFNTYFSVPDSTKAQYKPK